MATPVGATLVMTGVMAGVVRGIVVAKPLSPDCQVRVSWMTPASRPALAGSGTKGSPAGSGRSQSPELGIDKNTLIIFTSDNGGLDNGGKPTDNAPLRSGKGYCYEGGIRVPFLVRWPGIIPGGTTSDSPVSSIDLFPTILEAAGVPLPKDRPIDGLSLLPHLKSSGKETLRRDELIWHFPHYRHAPGPYSIIRKGDWKLISFWEGQRELFHLAEDPGEENNLAAAMPSRVKDLDALLLNRLKAQEAKLPRPNPDFVPKN